MEIRYSPYNAPFIPSGMPSGIHWIPREQRYALHSAHVTARRDWLLACEVAREKGRLLQEIRLLKELDDMASEGIKAAARRAVAIRSALNPTTPRRRFY